MIKNKSRPLVLLFSALLWASMMHAQESINASGGDAFVGGGGSMAYSVGIVVYTTEANGMGSIAQGVQHAYPNQKFKKFGTDEGVSEDVSDNTLAMSLTAFPNPTSQVFTLQMSEFDQEEHLMYQLSNTEGKIIEQGQIREEKTNFTLARYASGNYTLHVLNQENKTIKTFKIIKN